VSNFRLHSNGGIRPNTSQYITVPLSPHRCRCPCYGTITVESSSPAVGGLRHISYNAKDTAFRVIKAVGWSGICATWGQGRPGQGAWQRPRSSWLQPPHMSYSRAGPATNAISHTKHAQIFKRKTISFTWYTTLYISSSKYYVHSHNKPDRSKTVFLRS
jgi:hypothetical protein